MGRIWNVIGWMTITLIVPGLIFASLSEWEGDLSSLTHMTTCKACGTAHLGHQLPAVIDGDNLRVILPKKPSATTAGQPVAHHL